MSSSLVWQIVRGGHAHVKVCNGMKFSCEPGNATYQHSEKYSGFANNNTVDVAGFRKGKATLNLISTTPCGMKRTVKTVTLRRCTLKNLEKKTANVLKGHREDLVLPVQRRLALSLRRLQKAEARNAHRRAVHNKKVGKKTGKK